MRKKVLSIALVAAIVLSCAFMLFACNKTVNRNSSFELPNGSRPTYASIFDDADLATVEAALSDTASEQQKKDAVIALWNTANKSTMDKSQVSMMAQESLMAIYAAGINNDSDLSGMIVPMRGFTLNAGNDLWYNQFVAGPDKNKDDPFLSLAGAIGMMAKVQYRDEDGNYYFVSLNGDDNIDVDTSTADFPYASFLLTRKPEKMEYDEFIEQTHTLIAPGEIYNVDFCAEIIADGVTLVKEDGCYKLHFEVDMSSDSALLEKWYRKPQEDMQVADRTIIRYLSYVCDMEVWDTGHIKTYWAEYKRECTNSGSGVTRDVFHYLWNEDEILEILQKDYRLDELSELDKMQLETVSDYVNYYINAETVEGRANNTLIVFIVVAVAVVVAIILLIVIIVVVVKKKKKKAKAAAEAQAEENGEVKVEIDHSNSMGDYYDDYIK